VPNSFLRASRGLYVSFLRQRRNRLDHDFVLLDPRSATEHRMAHQRSLDEGGEGCPFCS
jgi:hypothetical protein